MTYDIVTVSQFNIATFTVYSLWKVTDDQPKNPGWTLPTIPFLNGWTPPTIHFHNGWTPLTIQFPGGQICTNDHRAMIVSQDNQSADPDHH